MTVIAKKAVLSDHQDITITVMRKIKKHLHLKSSSMTNLYLLFLFVLKSLL